MIGASLAMFPLGTVLFPYTFLPLRVFEPRFLKLTADCLAADQEFGVVLIERGVEVGGGDTRFAVATVAKIVQAERSADGFHLGTVGTRRITVTRWLPDNPYPRAEFEPLEDGGDDTADPGALEMITVRLRRVLGFCAELGDPAVSATVELHDDPTIALWQACACAPVGPIDQLRLLGTRGVTARVDVLREMLDDEALVLSHRLSSG